MKIKIVTKDVNYVTYAITWWYITQADTIVQSGCNIINSSDDVHRCVKRVLEKVKFLCVNLK